MRRATIERNTKETQIRVTLGLDSAVGTAGGTSGLGSEGAVTGTRRIVTPLPFLNHMLDTVARHGLLDLEVEASGDVEVDGHHTVEDVGICLGMAMREALGDKKGIRRFGEATIPMDETLVSGVMDMGGRAAFVYRADMLRGRWIGDFDAELAREFFGGFVSTALCNLHLDVKYGENAHHIVEALFKAFARCIRAAVEHDPRAPGIPSTKGTLTA